MWSRVFIKSKKHCVQSLAWYRSQTMFHKRPHSIFILTWLVMRQTQYMVSHSDHNQNLIALLLPCHALSLKPYHPSPCWSITIKIAPMASLDEFIGTLALMLAAENMAALVSSMSCHQISSLPSRRGVGGFPSCCLNLIWCPVTAPTTRDIFGLSRNNL